MKIKKVSIKGFRNFKEIHVNFNIKNLLIGQNDIGKTNFIYALRLLLDRSIPDTELDLIDSDFYSYEETNEIFIDVTFDDVIDIPVVSGVGEHIADSNELFLRFHCIRINGNITTQILIGKSFDELVEIDTRVYIRSFNLVYVGGSRDLSKLVRIQKKGLIDKEKENREPLEVSSDELLVQDVVKQHRKANKKISRLSYMSKATTNINQEMQKLMGDNEEIEYRFGILSRDEKDLTKRVDLISTYKGNEMEVGGYGRVNQIYFSLWKDKYIDDTRPQTQVRFYFIEEPEAHLHPHSQRALANYLSDEIHDQFLISTHSPHILAEFDPEDIIRFHSLIGTEASQNGASDIIGESLRKLSYRLNVVPSEAFFSKSVLLVEGKSEELFYKALAKHLKLDIDRNNISILSVEGVGFDVYYQALETLMIPCVVRTDLDISKKRDGKYRVAGIQRGIKIYRNYYSPFDEMEKLLENEEVIKGTVLDDIGKEKYITTLNEYREELKKLDIFIAFKDLENDLINSNLGTVIMKYFDVDEPSIAVKKLQKRKATNMFKFLSSISNELGDLGDDNIAEPLLRCVELSKKDKSDEDTDS